MDTPFKTSSAPAAAEQTPHKSCMRVGIHAFGTLCSPLYEHESNPDKRRRLRKRRQSGLMLLPSARKLKRTTAAQEASSAAPLESPMQALASSSVPDDQTKRPSITATALPKATQDLLFAELRGSDLFFQRLSELQYEKLSLPPPP